MTVATRDPARLSFLDRLTQLYNWWFMARYLRERVGWLVAEGTPLSVIVLDLDDFRSVNESRGRLAGDVVLREVALLLHEGRRKGAYAIRYAGDEFFVFLEGTGRAEALAAAEAIRGRIAATPIVVAHSPAGVSVTASLGVAALPEDVHTASGLIEQARRALAHAKRLGKNRVSQDLDERLPTDKEALRQLHRARLLGRERELEVCRRLFEEAPAGRNTMVMIEGERGLGKSRFLSELPALARQAGLSFLQGGCLPQNRAVPYRAITPWLQEYFDRSPELVAPVTARLAGPKLAALASLLPFLEATRGRAEGVSAPERRRQIFHGLLDLLGLMSDPGALVVLLENIDWADEASLEVLLHLLSREEGRVVVCATATIDRPEDTPNGPKLRSLADLLPYFQASPRFHRLPLARLSPLQVGEMTTDLLKHPAPTRFQQLLYQVSQGVPLLVEETLKGLIMRGALRHEEGAWSFEQVTPEDFPATADEAMARRLENLDPETLEVVSEASIIGADVDLPVLAEVLGQDPAETLDLVDHGRRLGLFETIDPLADPGEIRFSSTRLREVAYEGVEPVHRRQSHRKVAEVYERFAGPDVDEAIGPIAYHFERSDDAGKAGFYREKLRALRDWLFSSQEVEDTAPLRAGGAGTGTGAAGTGTEPGGGGVGAGGGREAATVKVRIPEVTEPLDPGLIPLAAQFAKVLTLACKNMRVFPEGNQLVRDQVAATGEALSRLLERLEGVTLAEQRGALRINGQPVEGKALAALTQDLLRLFKDHGIHSVTFVRGMVEAEVEEAIRILSGPPQGIPPDVGRWEEALAARGLLHVGIFPAIYLATALEATDRPEAEAVLDDETIRLSAEVFRSLAGAVDNLRLYPPENELNQAIQERLAHQARALLGRIPSVTLALAEDSVVINGVRPNPKWFGITIPLLHKLMQEHALSSVTLRRGVSRADLELFLSHLAQPGADDPLQPLALGRLLEERGITSIRVGTRLYAAARGSRTGGGRAGAGRGGGAGGAGPAAEAGRARRPPTEEERLFEQVSRWLDAQLGVPALPAEEFAGALESWMDSDRMDLARQLLDRISGGLASPLDSVRQRAAAALHALLAAAKGQARARVLERGLEPLEAALLKESNPSAFQWEVRAGAVALRLVLEQDELRAAGRLAEALGHGQAARPEQKKLLPVATAAVQALAQGGALEPLRQALRSEDDGRRARGQEILGALGEGALQFLAGIVREEEDERPRKAAAEVLRSSPGGGLSLLIPDLFPPAPPEASRRIVGVLDLLVPQPGPDFFPLLAHPDVLVRAEFAGVLLRLPRAATLRFLERALEEPHPDIEAGALECVRGLQGVELVEPLLKLVQRGTRPDVLKAACLCLAHLGDERAVRALVGLLERRPRLFGLVKGLPDTVRASAARALGEFALPEARRALRVALKDSSLAVRSTARVALSRIQSRREPR